MNRRFSLRQDSRGGSQPAYRFLRDIRQPEVLVLTALLVTGSLAALATPSASALSLGSCQPPLSFIPDAGQVTAGVALLSPSPPQRSDPVPTWEARTNSPRSTHLFLARYRPNMIRLHNSPRCAAPVTTWQPVWSIRVAFQFCIGQSTPPICWNIPLRRLTVDGGDFALSPNKPT